jgi:signal transduction histidine kinase
VAEKQLMRVQQVYDTGKSVRDEFELTLGEHQIWIDANFMPLKNKAGNVNTVLCIARDITENKNLEHQLVNAEKLASLGTLAAGVAHEINNPMGVILGFCDLLLQKTEKDSQTHEDLKIIERQGLHCKEVVENLLSFARLNKESSEYADLHPCLGEIISVVKHTLEMNDIELITRFAPDIPPVKGDPRQLQQVFLNLINNAVAAMENGGVLTIRTYLDRGGRKAVVQFKDSGTGIAPENMDRIFEPFFTTKPEGEGTGLGLFVSYGIIAKNGGTIDCVSHTKNTSGGGTGTTFTIKLPIRK